MNIYTFWAIVITGTIAVSAIPFQPKQNRRLIKTSESSPPRWVTEDEIWALIRKDTKFFDITDLKNFSEKVPQISQNKGIPTAVQYKDLVTKLNQNIDLHRIEAFIQTFSDFHNRFFNDSNGVQSEQWLLSQIRDSVKNYPRQSQISVREVSHNWAQNSIIARIDGYDPARKNEVVILGAHQDSINTQGQTLRAPGADDNASGCITVLEALRAAVANGLKPSRSVEFHWYSGEERGLLGSSDIAQQYKSQGVNVTGMINFDVVGYYVEGNEDVAIITDYVDNELTQFLRLLVDEYLDFGRRERDCGYACSDHASWTQNGFPAARPTQAVRNPQMHTLNDVISTVSFVQVREFAKVAIGFLTELSEPQKTTS